MVGHVVGYSFAKHWSGQSGINVLSIQVLILAVEHQCGSFTAQQVSEGTPHHGEAEHRAVLRGDSRDTGVKTVLGGSGPTKNERPQVNLIPSVLFYLTMDNLCFFLGI